MDRELISVKKILLDNFIPASKFFCDQRCLKFTTKPKLKAHFIKLSKDPRLKQLSATARSELAVLISRGQGYLAGGSMKPEQVWKVFLGGMSEGQSVGLRKWFSTHSQGITCVSKLENITSNPMDYDSTKWKCFRSIGSKMKQDLTCQIPSWAQVQSSAHPHIPFWPRLMVAVGTISSFDPDDDDVVDIGPVAPALVTSVINISDLSPTRLHKPSTKSSSSLSSQPAPIATVPPTSALQRTVLPLPPLAAGKSNSSKKKSPIRPAMRPATTTAITSAKRAAPVTVDLTISDDDDDLLFEISKKKKTTVKCAFPPW